MNDKVTEERKQDGRKEVDLSMPDFDDISLNDPFGEGGVAEGTGRKPSSPTKTMLVEGLKGIGGGVISGIKHEIRKTMPSVGAIADEVSAGYSEFKDLKRDVAGQLGPMLITLEDSARKVLPRAKRLMPKGMYEKISSKLDERYQQRQASTFTPASKEQGEQDYIKTELGAIFEQQQELSKAEALEEKKGELTRMALESARHKNVRADLTHIYDSLRSQELFHRTLHTGYLKKSLELKYKHLFIAKDTFNLLSRSMATFEAYFKALTRNTGLPDMMKIQIGDYHRKNVTEAYGKTMAKFKGNIRRHVIDAVKKKAKDAVQSFGIFADSVGMAADMSETMGSMPGADKAAPGMLAKGAGWLLGRLGAGPLAKKYLGRIRGVTDNLEESAANFRTNAFLKAANLRRNWTQSDNRVLRWLSDFLPNLTLEQTGSNDLLTKANDATPFDKMTRQSIVEIIPGYLGKIWHSIEKIRTGDDEIPEQIYNVYSRRFTTVDELKGSVSNQLYGSEATRRAAFTGALGAMQSGLERHGEKEDPEQYYKQYEKDINRFLVNHAVFHEFLDIPAIQRYVEAEGQSNVTPYIAHITTGFDNDPLLVLRAILHGLVDDKGKLDERVITDVDRAITSYRTTDTYKTEMPKLFETFGYRDAFADKITTAQKVELAQQAIAGDVKAAEILKKNTGIIGDDNSLNLAGIAETKADINFDESRTAAADIRSGKAAHYAEMDKTDQQIDEWMERTGISKAIDEVKSATKSVTDYVSGLFASGPEATLKQMEAKLRKMAEERGETYDSGAEAAPKAEEKPFTEVMGDLLTKFGEKVVNGVKDVIDNPTTAYERAKTYVQEKYDTAAEEFKNSETGKKVIDTVNEAVDSAKKLYEEKTPDSVKDALNQCADAVKKSPDLARDLANRIKDAYGEHVPEDVREKIDTIIHDANQEVTKRVKEASEIVQGLAKDPEYRARKAKKLRESAAGLFNSVPKTKEEAVAAAKSAKDIITAKAEQGKTLVSKAVTDVLGEDRKEAIVGAAKEAYGEASSKIVEAINSLKQTISSKQAEGVRPVETLHVETPKPTPFPTGTTAAPGLESAATADGFSRTISTIEKFMDLYKQQSEALTKRDEKRQEQLDAILAKMTEGHDSLFAATNWINKTLREMPPAIASGQPMPGPSAGGDEEEKLGMWGRGGAKVKKGFNALMGNLKWGIQGVGKVYTRIYGDALKGIGNAVGGIGKGVGSAFEGLSNLAKGGTLKHLLDLGAGGLKNIGKGYVQIYKKALGGIFDTTKTIATSLFGKKAEPYVDVYRKDEVGGNYRPILTAARQEREPGVFFKDGKRLRNSEDITEPIYDAEGKELITKDDIEHGLVGADNKPISTKKGSQGLISKILDIGKAIAPAVGNIAVKGFDLYKDLYTKLFGLGVGAVKGAGKMAGSFINRLFGFDYGGRSKEMLELVRGISENVKLMQSDIDLIARQEDKDKRAGDQDNDGDIDGTYQDQMQKKKADGKDILRALAGGKKRKGARAPGLSEDGEGGSGDDDDEGGIIEDMIKWEGGKWVIKKAKPLLKKAGRGIVKGGKWVGKGAVKGGKWIVKGLGKLGPKGKAVAAAGSAIASGAGWLGKLFKGGGAAAEAAGTTAQAMQATASTVHGAATAANAAKAGTGFLKGAGKLAGRAALPVAIGLEGISGGMEAYDAYKQGDTRGGNVAVGKTAGTIGGGLVGAKAGAAAGAAIGSIFPGVGTAIGGVLGGLVGALGGSWLGGKATGAAVGAIHDGLTKDKDGNPIQDKGPGRTESAVGSKVFLNGMWQGIKGNDLEMTKAEIEQARTKFKHNIEKGRPGYDKALEKFENAVAEGNWRLARQLTGKEADGFIAATWKHSLIGGAASNLGSFFLGVGKDNEEMTKEEIDKARAKFNSVIKKGGSKAKIAQRTLDKFDDYVAEGNWKRARAIAGEDFQKGWGVIGSIGSGIKNLFVADEDKPMTEEEVKKHRERLQKLIQGGNKAAQKILDQFDDAVTEMNWKKARRLVGEETMSGLGFLNTKGFASAKKWTGRILTLGLSSFFESDQETPMTDQEIEKFTKKMNYLISKGDKAAKRKLDKFEEAVAAGKWEKAREIAKMPHKSDVQKKIASISKSLFGDDESEMTEEEMNKFRESMQRKIKMGSQAAQKKLDAFEDAVLAMRWKRARAIADAPDEGAFAKMGSSISNAAGSIWRFFGGGDDESMSEDEIKRARIKMEQAVKDGKKNAQKRLDMFDDYVADQKWEKARKLADMPYESLAARMKKGISDTLFGNDDNALKPEEIEKFQNECQQRIEDGNKKAQNILDKFNDAVASENWSRARKISGIKDWGATGVVAGWGEAISNWWNDKKTYEDCKDLQEKIEDKATEDESGVVEKGLEDFIKLVRRQKYNEAYKMGEDLLKLKVTEAASKYKLESEKLVEFQKTAEDLEKNLRAKAETVKGGWLFNKNKMLLTKLAEEVQDPAKWCEDFFADIRDRADEITGEGDYADIDKPDDSVIKDGEQLLKDIETASDKFSWFTSPLKKQKLSSLRNEVNADVNAWCEDNFNKWKEHLKEIDQDYNRNGNAENGGGYAESKDIEVEEEVEVADEEVAEKRKRLSELKKKEFEARFGDIPLTEDEKAELDQLRKDEADGKLEEGTTKTVKRKTTKHIGPEADDGKPREMDYEKGNIFDKSSMHDTVDDASPFTPEHGKELKTALELAQGKAKKDAESGYASALAEAGYGSDDQFKKDRKRRKQLEQKKFEARFNGTPLTEAEAEELADLSEKTDKVVKLREKYTEEARQSAAAGTEFEGMDEDEFEELAERGRKMEENIGQPKSNVGKRVAALKTKLGFGTDNNIPTVEEVEKEHPNWMNPDKMEFEVEDEEEADQVGRWRGKWKDNPEIAKKQERKAALLKKEFESRFNGAKLTEAEAEELEGLKKWKPEDEKPFVPVQPSRMAEMAQSLAGMRVHGMLGNQKEGWEFGADIGSGNLLKWTDGKSELKKPEELTDEELMELASLYSKKYKKAGLLGDYTNKPAYMAQNEINRRQKEATGNDGHGAVGKYQAEQFRVKQGKTEEVKTPTEATKKAIDKATGKKAPPAPAATTTAPIKRMMNGAEMSADEIAEEEELEAEEAAEHLTGGLINDLKDPSKRAEIFADYNVAYNEVRPDYQTLVNAWARKQAGQRFQSSEGKEAFIAEAGAIMLEAIEKGELKNKPKSVAKTTEAAVAPRDRTEERILKQEARRARAAAKLDAEQADAEDTYDTVSRTGGKLENGGTWDKVERSGIRIAGEPIRKSGLSDKQMGIIDMAKAMGEDAKYPDYVREMYENQLPDYQARMAEKQKANARKQRDEFEDGFASGGFMKRFADGGFVDKDEELTDKIRNMTPEQKATLEEIMYNQLLDYQSYSDNKKILQDKINKKNSLLTKWFGDQDADTMYDAEGNATTVEQQLADLENKYSGDRVKSEGSYHIVQGADGKYKVGQLSGKRIKTDDEFEEMKRKYKLLKESSDQYASGGFVDSIRSKLGDITGQGERDTMRFADACVKHFEDIGIDKIAKFLSTDDANHDPADLLQEFPLPEGTKVGMFNDPRSAAELAIQMMCRKYPEIQKAMEIRTGGLSFDPYEQMKTYLAKQGKFAEGGFATKTTDSVDADGNPIQYGEAGTEAIIPLTKRPGNLLERIARKVRDLVNGKTLTGATADHPLAEPDKASVHADDEASEPMTNLLSKQIASYLPKINNDHTERLKKAYEQAKQAFESKFERGGYFEPEGEASDRTPYTGKPTETPTITDRYREFEEMASGEYDKANANKPGIPYKETKFSKPEPEVSEADWSSPVVTARIASANPAPGLSKKMVAGQDVQNAKTDELLAQIGQLVELFRMAFGSGVIKVEGMDLLTEVCANQPPPVTNNIINNNGGGSDPNAYNAQAGLDLRKRQQ